MVPGIDRLVGHGVYYGASPSEASLVQGRTVHLVGGGNSAGQTAMFFAEYADSVTMLVRGSSLAASMSQYLIDRLSRQANVSVELGAEVSGVEGRGESRSHRGDTRMGVGAGSGGAATRSSC